MKPWLIWLSVSCGVCRRQAGSGGSERCGKRSARRERGQGAAAEPRGSAQENASGQREDGNPPAGIPDRAGGREFARVTPQMPKKFSMTKTTLPSSHAATGLEGRNTRRAETEKVAARTLLEDMKYILIPGLIWLPSGTRIYVFFVEELLWKSNGF
ncbi:uncharacterized protein GJ701_016415 [Geothlypis trichas]